MLEAGVGWGGMRGRFQTGSAPRQHHCANQSTCDAKCQNPNTKQKLASPKAWLTSDMVRSRGSKDVIAPPPPLLPVGSGCIPK